jgi:hypothetical protein
MVPYLVSGTGLIMAGIINTIVGAMGGWGSPILMDGSTEYSGETML